MCGICEQHLKEIRRELSRSIRVVKQVRQARRLLPEDVGDLTASTFTTVLSALPFESWKRVTDEIKNPEARGFSAAASARRDAVKSCRPGENS